MPTPESNTPRHDAIFGNLGTAMVTPFTPAGEVDYDQAAALATKLVDEGCDNLVVTGTTGETSTLTDEENVGMFRTVVEAVGDRAKIIAGSTTNDTAHSIQLSQAAAKVGVHGLLVTAPYYNKPSQAGVRAHVETLASCTDLPVMVYDIPGRTGISISTETLIRLAEHPNVVALKDAKADYQATTRVLASTDLDVYSGDDGLTLPLMAAGAQGVISVTAHVATAAYRRLVDALLAGDLATARALHFELDPIQRAVMSHIQGAVAAKTVLKWQGVLSNAIVRLPLVEPTDAEAAPIRANLAEAGINL
ncbi:MAG: 4-hydroxy-tetrahydrodipicolinate synthase [Arthrobacter sp.]|uniref:4-hydroxy-tetrahydrodipicolinate synthase n=1 Tax=unclassified Arthrobacter TaxID=235627 RepID=UPI002651A166|nr:4-hydroxy-tetrahydrodipicolinate synthase [Micrococcaceae bacterium]MDN5824093.1 4-hydroxy-tetrahydrodipicolinate synthase [Micrococcaceae bacterium]MDN5878080.1 4-hydroxy-tetrahydrodipicolinate synthase [Micrococcaceae bacterium]MDN5886838.1 4-hydroxy-tetrahydrodipicolinate synthase [Micrococcaceae bacterium]MDN5904711.1 4-hydroxy-tetrahydrodipicolinate synthase [Micrococcaceae bacterium]